MTRSQTKRALKESKSSSCDASGSVSSAPYSIGKINLSQHFIPDKSKLSLEVNHVSSSFLGDPFDKGCVYSALMEQFLLDGSIT